MDDDFPDDEDWMLEAAESVDRYIEDNKPHQMHIDCLKREFGHNQFRPMQWEIIRSIIVDKRDNCVVMPTGYGKSLCFQFPSVLLNGVTIVVSPLISLMQDQVFALSLANIPATFLGSAQKDKSIEGRIVSGEFRLVYASPEYLSGDFGRDLLAQLRNKLTLIAIDEAHCVSHWGHDFRRDYRKLGNIRSIVSDVPILAVTATATPDVREDICRQLKMRNPQVLCTGFDRPNLEFKVFAKTDNEWNDLKPFVTNVKGSIIIYVIKKKSAEEVAGVLNRYGVKCEYYHAAVANQKRKDILEDFTKDRLQIIVATVAFGMGIDKPDVRLVIHYGPSKNLETYYQEVGRAGRDGFPAKAITFYKNSDFGLIEWLLSQNLDCKSVEVINHLREIAKHMREYIMTKRCRRVFLLEYFQSDTSTIFPRSDCCDNCQTGASSIRLDEVFENVTSDGKCDFTEDALLLLLAMKLTNSSATAIGVLKGSGERKAQQFKHDELFGKGKLKHKDYWATMVKQLKNDKLLYVKELPAPYRSKLVISALGYDWIKWMPEQRLVLKAISEMQEFFVKKKSTSLMNNLKIIQSKPAQAAKVVVNPIEEAFIDKQLEDILLSIRTELAFESNCTPFLVASNAALQEMTQLKPANIHQFKASIIDGFSVAKIEKFSSHFIKGIAKFLNNEFSMEHILRKHPFDTKLVKITEKQLSMMKLIRSKKSLADLGASLNLTPEQTFSMFLDCIKSGCAITREHLGDYYGIDDGFFSFIKSHIDPSSDINDISLVRAKCHETTKVSDDMIKLVLTFVRVRDHLNKLMLPYYDPAEGKLVNASLLLKKPTSSLPLASTSKVSSSYCAINDFVDDYDDSYDHYLASLTDQYSQSSSQVDPPKPQISLSKYEVKNPNILSNNAGVSSNLYTSAIPVKLEQKANASSAVAKVHPPTIPISKRVTMKPKSKVVYCDSDSDDEDQNKEIPEKEPQKRVMPGWLSKASITTSYSVAKKKKFF